MGGGQSVHHQRTTLLSLADPELQKRGGPNFCRNFWTTFFRRFQKNFSISPQNFIYLPKFL